MRLTNVVARTLAPIAAGCMLMLAASAADFPTPKEGDWVAHDFKFHDGAAMPELKLHYTTVGDPKGEPVLILHGTMGSGAGMLSPDFAGELFGPGQPLDAAKYFVILPDSIGTGKSSKPSDGLHAKFPRYDYDDMVLAQYRLVTEELGLKHLRLVLGNSMGGMQTWIWGVQYPAFMDALVPMASQPTEMASRNWMMRRMLIDAIRNDPDWNGGEYTSEPKGWHATAIYFNIATNGGMLAYQKAAPTHELTEKFIAGRLAAPFKADANDALYQWDASRDYNAAPGLEKIEAPLLAVNSADDERNPPESGIMERELKRVKSSQLYLIPASADTRGHGTAGAAKFWKSQFEAFLRSVPHRGS